MNIPQPQPTQSFDLSLGSQADITEPGGTAQAPELRSEAESPTIQPRRSGRERKPVERLITSM